MSKKLTFSDKVEIILSRRQESLRELAERYGVHHSVIDDIFKESEKILTQYWAEKSKRKGRPPTPVDAQAELMAQTDAEKKQLNKQLALKQMRIDWLELQLKWAIERAAEAGLKSGKQLKKKEKIEIIELVEVHGQAYGQLTQAERLGCLALTPASFLHIQRTTRERLQRESAIGDEDVKQAVQQIIEYPFLGGHKGSLKLQCDQKALVGETFYKDIKQQLRLEAEKELQRRREQCELENNQYKRQVDKDKPFEKIVPEEKHEVWAIDFVTFLLFGIYFRICVVYEVFSQAYLSIIPAEVATYKIAAEALMSACEYSGQRPKICLLSDNGGQFICYSFEQVRQKLDISGQQIPPGQPWHNGALESGNRDLKKVLYTIAFQEACRDIEISRRGADRQRLLNGLKSFCVKTQQVINEEIVRPKFKTTPMSVLKEQVFEKNQKRVIFVESKVAERKQRMEHFKKQGGVKREPLEDKVKKVWNKMSLEMSINEIYAFCELLNERYHAVAA